MQAGDLVAGRFEIERLAGTGGMGAVFRARDRLSGAPVAIKVLAPGSRSEIQRFEREARILAELVHPGIVRYLSHGASPSGERYLAIEWLEGEDLATRLGPGPMSLEESLLLARRTARALAEAHRRGVVHRDIKPGNLFLPHSRIEDVKILDFGIAHLARHGKRATLTGVTVGTPGYMSPEQARGDSNIDARADVFSLGCVLFECVTGRPAFSGDHFLALLAKIVFADPPRPRDFGVEVPAAVEDLIGAMLSKEPSERPEDAAAVESAIASLKLEKGEPRRVQEPSKLTASEQRWLSVVLARAARDLEDDVTLSSAEFEAFVSPLRNVVEPFSGRLEVLADGSVVVTLAGGSAVTDRASNAARCALAVRRLLPDAPMALASGRGRVDERWPVGDVIDRAVQLVRSGPRGAAAPTPRPIYIDEVTASLLGARFEIASVDGGLELRDEHEAEIGARTLLGRRTPCVGRDAELTLLETMFNECVEEPRMHAVVVTGPPGAGKSRLRAEFLQRARIRRPDVEIWMGRGDAIASGSPFGVIKPALRQAFGLEHTMAHDEERARIVARVSERVPPNEARRISEFLSELLDVPFEDDSMELRVARRDPTLLGDQMRRAFVDFVAAECEAHPVILVLEDLQWGDLPSVAYVEAAVRQLSDRPLLMIGLGRPEVFEVFPQLWEERELQTIRLARLSPKACERLVLNVLENVERSVVVRIVERSLGNAFHLEELIRAVAEGRGAELPETVLATLEARLGLLDPEARRVLRAASVFGRVFCAGGVACLLGHADGAWLEAWLTTLDENEIIERRSTRSADEQEYMFRHALLRDAAYAMLTDDDRALGHRLAGDWLERMGETDAVTLAEHFARGREPARALRWFVLAARRALEGHGFSDAIGCAERALTCGASGALLGELRLVQAEAFRWQGDFELAHTRAVEAARELPLASVEWFRAVQEVLIACGRLGEFEIAEAFAAEIARAAAPADAASAQVGCLCAAVRVLFQAGRYEIADELGQRVHELIHERVAYIDPSACAEVARLEAARARHLGDLQGDLSGYEQALIAYEQAGDVHNACNARVSLGFSFAEMGAFERARAELEQALADAERMALSTVATRARQNLGLVLLARGDHAAARRLLERVITESQAVQNARFEAWTRIYLSSALLAAGDAVRAEDEARRATNLLATSPPAQAGALAALGRALVELERSQEAREVAAGARKILERYGGIEEFESLVHVAWIEALFACGEVDAAKHAAGDALARLDRRASGIEDAELRASFLGRVPENVRLRELARG